MKSIEDVLGKDYVQKALNNGVPTTLLEGEALHKVGVSPDVLDENQKFALQKYRQAAQGKFQSASEKKSEPSSDWKKQARGFLNDNSLGRGLGSLISRYTLTANVLTGNTLLNEQERKNILKYQEMVEKKKEEKNASFLSPARKKAIDDLKLKSQNAQGFTENLKLGAENVFDTLTHPREWTTEGIIDNIADPINLVGFGVGNIAGKALSRIAPKIANSLAAKMAIGGVAGSVEGGGVNALQSLGEELGKGKTLQQATKSATQALSAGALAGGVLGSAGGGAAHIGVSKDTGVTPSVGFRIKDKPKYEDLTLSEKENIKNEILNNELLKNEADPIVSTKIKDNIDDLHQGSVQSLKDSIKDLALGEEEAKAINQQAKELALAGVKDLDAIEVSDRLKTYTQIINDGNSVLDPRLEGTGILHTLEDNIKNPLLSPDDFFSKLKQKGVVDELAKITTQSYIDKNPNILQNYIEEKLTQATEAKIAADITDHIQAIPDRDLGRVIKNNVVVDDRAGVNEPVVYKVIPAQELKPMFKSGEGTQHRFADNTSMISRIVNDFNPDLHFGREGGFDGVPIVDYAGHIVTGNHRADAIKSMYLKNKADLYIEGIKKYYGEDVLEGIKDPVLVRELLTRNDDKIQRIAKVSNEGRENSIADSLITNGAKIEPFINRLPPIINNNFELANYLHIQGVNDQAAAQGLLSYINPKIAHYVDSYLKNKRNDPRIFGILIDNAYLFWNAKTYAKAPNMEGVDISNLLHTAIERLSVQKEPTAKKELERVLDHYSDAFLNTAGQKKFSQAANIEELKGELLGIILYSLVGRKDGGREAFKDRFDRAIGTAKEIATPNLLTADPNYDPKQTQWDMLSYLFDTGKEEEANADFSSNLLNSKYESILKELIRVEKEKENDPTIYMAGDPTNTEPVSTFISKSEQMGGATIPTTSRSVQSSDRQGSRSDLPQSKSARIDEGETTKATQPDRGVGNDLSEIPSIERFLGDDTLPSREGDDRALSRTKPVLVSDNVPSMHEQLDGNGTDSRERIQQFLDEGRDGGADSRSKTLNRSSHNKQTLSYHPRGDTSNRAGDQGIQREDGDKGENERRAGVGGDARDSLQRSLHLPVTDFGTNYPEYYHDGKGAIQKLLQTKEGQVKGAFHKEGLGDIDLVWGDSKMGLAHILEKHPEVIDKIPEIINDGKILNKGETRKFIKDDKYNIVISENFRGKDKRWLLTAYEDYPSQPMSISDGFHSQLQHESSRSNPLNPNPTTEQLKNQDPLENIHGFGTNYPEYYHNGKGAIEKLLQEKQGQVKGAFHKEGLGDIDLVWGDSKMGLAHILEKHPEVIDKIPEIINDGELVTSQAGIHTIINNEYKVGLSKGWFNKGDNNWIVTAYEDTRGRDKTFDSVPVNPKETLSETPMPNPTTEKLKNQDPLENIHGFGTNYPEYYHNGKGAIQKLLQEKQGQVKGAFHKEGLGDIDLVWGEVSNAEKHTGYGLAHIVDKHPEIVDRIPEIMDKGVFLKDEKNRLKIQLGNEIIGIKDNWKGEKTNHWIVTSYEKEGDKSLYTSSSPLKQEEILSRSSLDDSTTQEIKNQDPLENIHGFGTNYPEYYHNGKGAIQKLLQEKQGQVKGAFHKEGLGDIDLVWGEVSNAEKHTGYGLAHIVDKHPEITPEKLENIITEGQATIRKNEAVKIEKDGYKVVLKGNWKGEPTENKWVVTAYEKNQEAPSISSDANHIEESLSKTSSNLTQEEIKNQDPLENIHGFGTNYPEYYHDGKGAIQKLLQTKQGQVKGAFYRPDIGDITLVWGKEGKGKSDGFGLAKIVKFHPEALDKLDEIISNGAFLYDEKQRPNIVLDDYIVGIRNDWKGNETPYWVISSYYKKDSIKGIDSNETIAAKENYSLNNPLNPNPNTEQLKNQELKTKKISEQLSEGFKEAYNKYESTKSKEYQQTKEIQKSDAIVGITANVYTKVADEIMDKSSLELARHNNWVKETIKDPFGINFKKSTFSSIRGKEALETLLTYKLGQVKGAFHKEGLGDIDLVWGDSKMGLAHILEKHPEVIDKIPEIIEKGITDENSGAKRIEYNNARVGLSKGWFNKGENHWVITAYDLLGGDEKGSKSSSFYSDLETPKRDLLPGNPFENLTTEQLKNQELGEEIQQEALDFADKANPTQDTQPYLPLVESVEKRVLQNKAEAKKEIVFNDLEDIKKDLPYLLKEQAEDVKFAEQRFSTGARGVLFTNGTGTGKTFTGLGIAKRKLKMGAKNILILTQSTQKNIDWKKEGKILNIDIVEVSNTKDNPNGTIIATYANFRENKGLNSRTYDLIIYDESQSILGSKEGSITEIFEQHQNIAIWNYLAPDTPRTDENFHKANELAKNNQVVFLSATPFASHKALKYGQGLLFGKVDNDFFIENFGYKIRYSKLTSPQRVDIGQLERDFADKLAKNGVKRGRRLMSDYDYNRAFMKVDGGLGKEIDGALDILSENGKKYEEQQYKDLYPHYKKKFNYHYVNKISESIKAKETLEFVKDNLAKGRKMVIFHSYNEGGVVHPFIENFDLKEQESLYKQYELFKKEHPQYFKEMNFENPLDLYKKELGNRVDFYNGKVSKKNRSRALELFNDDDSGVDVLVVQIDAGGTGISLHDKTGVHPRVAIKLNIPTKPITEIQSEGRVYRTGQKSNTAYVYPVTHLGIEQRVFGSSINERISTVENLALGSEARNLKDTFKEGYLQASEFDARTLEFTGGKDYDRAIEKLEPYAKAINDYFSQKSNKFDGVDYFPTPEPIGYKMARWADVSDGESVLEPSAGSGSIARYFSEGARATAIEPSNKLFSKLQVNISSENPRLLNKNFEDLNPREKFDGVVMNPPFGENSITAANHLKKALSHLNSEGRVVALVPSGNSMMKHLANLEDFTKDIKKDRGEEFKIVAEISLPSVTFKRAGTNVNTKILIIDKTKNEVSSEVYDFSHIDKIEDLFVELGNIELPKRERVEKLSYDEPLASLLHNGVMKVNEKKLNVSIPTGDIERSRLNEIWKVAKDLGGMYLRGKIVFANAENFKKFIESEDC